MLQLWVRGDLLVLLERSLLQHRVSTEPLAQVKIQSNGFALKYSLWIIESAFRLFLLILLLNGLYIMYIICALQGTQEKLPEEALRAAKESEGEDCCPHTHVIWVFSCNTNNNNNKASANYHLKTPEWACQMIICRCGKVFSCSVFSQDWKKKDFPPIVQSGWSKHISKLRLAPGGYVLRSYWVKTEHFLAVRLLRQAQTAQSIILLSS